METRVVPSQEYQSRHQKRVCGMLGVSGVAMFSSDVLTSKDHVFAQQNVFLQPLGQLQLQDLL